MLLVLMLFDLQICPLRRPIKWENAATFASPSAKSFAFPVVSGQTMELALAQFWSSGLGSREPTIVEFEVGTQSYIYMCVYVLTSTLCFVLSFVSSCIR